MSELKAFEYKTVGEWCNCCAERSELSSFEGNGVGIVPISPFKVVGYRIPYGRLQLFQYLTLEMKVLSDTGNES